MPRFLVWVPLVLSLAACSTTPPAPRSLQSCHRYRVESERQACLRDGARREGAPSASDPADPPEPKILNHDR